MGMRFVPRDSCSLQSILELLWIVVFVYLDGTISTARDVLLLPQEIHKTCKAARHQEIQHPLKTDSEHDL